MKTILEVIRPLALPDLVRRLRLVIALEEATYLLPVPLALELCKGRSLDTFVKREVHVYDLADLQCKAFRDSLASGRYSHARNTNGPC